MSNGFKIQIASLTTVLVVSTTIALSGHIVLAQLVSMFGTIGVLGGLMIWIVAIDSRKRWPDVGWFDRFARVVTFYRD
jgi:hypothetical protein